jgi:hypothetical protein
MWQRFPDGRRAARRFVHCKAQLHPAHRDRELAVGRPCVWGVLAKQLELRNMAGGEVPRTRVKLEHLAAA